jgi:hypothetical protein
MFIGLQDNPLKVQLRIVVETFPVVGNQRRGNRVVVTFIGINIPGQMLNVQFGCINVDTLETGRGVPSSGRSPFRFRLEAGTVVR